MTHYTRTYSNSEGPIAKRNAAVLDCLEYLGAKHYSKVRKAIRNEFNCTVPLMRQRKAIRFTAMSLCMTGIQGFPAHALVIDVLREGA